MTKNEHLLIAEIAKRADEQGLLHYERMSMIMDLNVAHEQFNLDLNALLNAPDVDFAHDINGIQSNINRQTKTIENLFLPRYARG